LAATPRGFLVFPAAGNGKRRIRLKNRNVNLIVAGVLVLLAGLLFLRFYVSGGTVAKAFGKYENYEVTLTKSLSMDPAGTPVVLTSQQKGMLKKLFMETPFRRTSQSEGALVRDSATNYEIVITGTYQSPDGDVFTGPLFRAGSLGGEYFDMSETVSGAYSGHLKIYNSQWDARMEEILALSESVL
jgi:hypothetical protein